MSDPLDQPKFRRNARHPLTRYRRYQCSRNPRPTTTDASSQPPKDTPPGGEIAIHVESPTASNELLVVDIYDQTTGKQGHTAVAIHSGNNVNSDTVEITIDSANNDTTGPDTNKNSFKVELHCQSVKPPENVNPPLQILPLQEVNLPTASAQKLVTSSSTLLIRTTSTSDEAKKLLQASSLILAASSTKISPQPQEPITLSKALPPASSKPLPASSRPLPAASKPLPASSRPLPAASKPFPASSRPLPASSRPLPASSKTVEEQKPLKVSPKPRALLRTASITSVDDDYDYDDPPPRVSSKPAPLRAASTSSTYDPKRIQTTFKKAPPPPKAKGRKKKAKRTLALDPVNDDEDYQSLPVISSSCGYNLWMWGDDVDTQDVASDTQDLEKLMPQAQFILNFTHYDGEEFNVHVGLRKKYPLSYNLNPNPNNFIPPNTDDYNREFFRHLKTQEKLTMLKLVLEVHLDDDIFYYKVFDDDSSSPTAPQIEFNAQSQYPVIRSNLGAFWNNKTIPVGLTFVHVEVPGLSVFYLNDWKRFLEMQSKLTTLICNFGSVLWTFYANVVVNNEKTLEKVVLRRVISYDVKNRRQVPFDFGIFQRASELTYLKITGGGYKERWGEWAFLGQEQAKEELLLHVNFELLPVEKLEELHYTKTEISKRKLQQLIIRCNDKNLRLICTECPDKEYYDGDWEIVNTEKSDVFTVDASSNDTELGTMFSRSSSAKRHLELYQAQQQQRNNLIVFLLVLCLIAFVGMTVAVGVAIYYSNMGRDEKYLQ